MQIKREKMGEVHVRVRLSNAVDVTLVKEGKLEPDKIRNCEVEALVDTGATMSIIPQDVFRQLGLNVLGNAVGRLAADSQIAVELSSGIVFEIEGRRTLQDAYVLGNTVLIGQTVLEATDLLVDCTNHRVIPRHPEGHIVRL
jgi:clan AA aspartic protease